LAVETPRIWPGTESE